MTYEKKSKTEIYLTHSDNLYEFIELNMRQLFVVVTRNSKTSPTKDISVDLAMKCVFQTIERPQKKAKRLLKRTCLSHRSVLFQKTNSCL